MNEGTCLDQTTASMDILLAPALTVYRDTDTSPGDVRNWLEQDSTWLRSVAGKNFDSEQIIMQAKKQEKTTRHHFLQFFENFIKIVV